ncbi:phytoene/squalene synthase family protein [Vulgatibacter sp.]|uniref:phytoene/squalene synthase family protein n=1 Tax=Vulgatibacter sp. TaxID=1971226 RepID=UPI00356B3BB7
MHAEALPAPALDPADLARCGALLRAGSKSFAAASRILPRHVRVPATALYAFCRVADDAIDDAGAARAEALAGLHHLLDRVYAGAPAPDPVERALAAVVHRHRLPRAPLDALLEGFAWDAAGRRYETLDDVVAYSVRVASTVGVAMTLLMGERDPAVLARACDLGVAMQLTNIARDVGEDARAGRLYLPLAWMREAGIDPDAFLRAPVHGAALAGVVERLLAEADRLYASADRGIPALPASCRPAIRAARLVYAAIGERIRAAGCDAVSRRAVVPRRRKIALLLRSCLALCWPRRACDAPPLEPARFLLDAVR